MVEMCSEWVEKLTVAAEICSVCGAARQTAVCRGMSVCSSDGQVVGEVAAILLDGRTQQPSQLVLCCQVPDYRLVPIEQIHHVDGRIVQLTLSREQISQLPHHQPKL